MTQTEHLKLIRARCVELLEIAEKRTAGAWSVKPFGNWEEYEVHPCIGCGEPAEATGMTLGDATFVASCGTGSAEAGWLATVAAIDDCLNVDQSLPKQVQEITAEMMMQVNGIMVDRIIKAWPIELLNNK